MAFETGGVIITGCRIKTGGIGNFHTDDDIFNSGAFLAWTAGCGIFAVVTAVTFKAGLGGGAFFILCTLRI